MSIPMTKTKPTAHPPAPGPRKPRPTPTHGPYVPSPKAGPRGR